MTTGMNLWDADVWSFVLTLSMLFAAMIAANVLRNTFSFIRRALIPSSVLGGFLLLVVKEACTPGRVFGFSELLLTKRPKCGIVKPNNPKQETPPSGGGGRASLFSKRWAQDRPSDRGIGSSSSPVIVGSTLPPLRSKIRA